MSQLEKGIESFNLSEIERILSALANEDALKILVAAKDGIQKSTETIKELKLTQRRYYARLNDLLKAGLIEKIDDVYQLTTLGKICYSLGETFNSTLNDRERLDLADKLQKAKTISSDETNQILQAIATKSIVGTLGISDILHPVKMIASYDNLVYEIVSQIENAEKSIYLASYYTDPRAVEAILKAFERGLDLSFLSSNKKSIIEKLQILRMILNPTMIKLFAMFQDSRIKVKTADFPFSFCIIDEKKVIIELPNPFTDSFYLGFCFENNELAKNLIETFQKLYEEGKEHPLLGHLQK